MLQGFKDFISKGNVVDLAVGVIIGGAFGGVVNSLVADVITPLIGLVFGKPDFSAIRIAADAAGKGGIAIGNFLNAIVGFLMIAAAVYFFIVVPMGKLKKPAAPAEPAPTPEDVLLLREIRDNLKR